MADSLTKWGVPVDALTESELVAFLGGRQPEDLSDRRSSVRRGYRCIRAIADCKDDGEPADAFYSVQCRDLSARGIGFFSPKHPATEALVIRLSAEGERPLLVGARVVYCDDKSGDALFPFVVGCMFTGRL